MRAFHQQPRYRSTGPVIRTWIAVTRRAVWINPIEVKTTFGQTDILSNGRAFFDLGGNKFRLVKINDQIGIVFVRFIGTNAEYDRIDAGSIQEASWTSAPSATRPTMPKPLRR